MRKLFLILFVLTTVIFVCASCGSGEIITQDMIEGGNTVEYWVPSGEYGAYELYETITINNQGDTFTFIEPPVIPGYVFEGWYANVSSPYEADKFEQGTPLKPGYGFIMSAYYTAVESKFDFYYNGVLLESVVLTATTNIAGLKDAPYINYDHFAVQLNQINNTDFYTGEHIYIEGFYLDGEYTQRITDDDRFENGTDVHVKINYCPVNLSSYDNNDIIVSNVNSYIVSEHLDGKLIIPAKNHYGYTITAIASNAFENCYGITEVVLPDTITTIQDNAFASSSITKITIPESVTYIGDGAFRSCYDLTEVTINTNASFDVNSVFESCDNIQYEEFGGAYYIGKYLMGLVDGATNVELKSICDTIPNGIFEGSSIQSIKIPNGVTSIGDSAFANCTALETVIFNCDIDFDVDSVFSGCSALKGEKYDNAYYIGKYFVCLASNDVTSVNIKPGCPEIPENAFKLSSVSEVTIPASVKKIGNYAFEGTPITSVVIPEAVEDMGIGAFKDCEQLVNVTLNSNISFIFNDVFTNCNAIELEEYGSCYYLGNIFVKPVSNDILFALIKDGCTDIPDEAFKDHTKLNKVYIPKSVTSVGYHAFYNVNTAVFACLFEDKSSNISFASGADESFLPSTNQPINYYFHTMPNGITIDENGFAYGYRDLMDFTGKDVYGFGIFGYFGNDEKITIADKYTYNGTEYPVGVIFQHLLFDNTTVKSVTIKCSFLVASEAFMNAYALEEVILPSSGCEQIGMKAFAGCTSLKKVTIGSGFQIIFKSAFEGCTSLTEVTCNTDLKAWTSDVSLVQSFEANENLNNALLGNCKDCWFFAAEYNSAVVEATIKSFGY